MKRNRRCKFFILLLAVVLALQTVTVFTPVLANQVKAIGNSVMLDFEDGNKGSWSGTSDDKLEIVPEGDNHVLKITTQAHDQYLLNKDLEKFVSGKISFQIKTEVANRFGFAFRNNGGNSPAFVETATKDRWNLYDGSKSTFFANKPFLIPNEWNKVEIEFNDNHYILRVNGITYVDETITGYTNQAGSPGFKFMDGEKGQIYYIDNYAVSSAPEETSLVNLTFDDDNAGTWGNLSEANRSIVEEDGNKVLKIHTSTANQYVVNQDAASISSGKVTFRFKPTVQNRYGFTVRYTQGNAPTFIKTPTANRWNLYDGSKSNFIDNCPDLAVNEWSEIEILFSQDHYVFKVNGTTYLDAEVTGYTQAAGLAGFKFLDGNLGQDFYIDDFSVSRIDDGQITPPQFTITPDSEHKTEADLAGKMWYNSPASNWETEALPIGNGSLGGMFFGKVDKEVIQLNEITLWDGGPNAASYGLGYNKVGASSHVDEFADEFYSENASQSRLTQISDQLTGREGAFGAYQNFGNFKIDMTENLTGDIAVTNYRRELSLNEGLGRVYYTIGDVDYTREYLASYPDDVLAVRLTASGEKQLNFTISGEVDDSPSNVGQANGFSKSKTYTTTAQGDTITTQGKINASQIAFAAQYKVLADGAEITANSDNSIRVSGADSATILISIKSDYVNENDQFTDQLNPPDYKSGENPLDAVEEAIGAASAKAYDDIRAAHQQDYQNLFARNSIQLGNSTVATLPTDDLLQASSQKKDRNPYMDELLYQYGRYLLISSSRDAQLSANLQGLWNNSNKPPWNSDFHYNVNIQMIYWPAYATNLAETSKPFIDLIDSLKTPGEITAKEYHNVDQGFVFHMKTNAFGFTAPGTSFSWGWSPGSSAWALQNVWENYEFTGDKELLESTIYPLLKGNCEFWLANLREDPKTGDLVSVPSFSPEQGLRTVGTTFDQELIWQLFTDTITASEELGGVDSDFIDQIKAAKERLNPLEIGESGQIKEWREEGLYNRDQNGNRIGEDNHRHCSQLLGLYPGKHITTDTPEYMEAAKASLRLRGNGGTGWSKAHKINLWARTQDASETFDILTSLVNKTTPASGGGFYANLFDSHPPFQIDGNMGTTSGIAEMLLQSQTGVITPIPTLPDQWADGSFKGMVARGNYVVDASWSDKQIDQLTILANNGGDCKVKFSGADKMFVKNADGENVPFTVVEQGQTIQFSATAGETYVVDSESGTQPPSVETDRSILNKVIEYAQNQKDAPEYKNVIDMVKTSFEAALEHAVQVTENAASTQEQIDAAWKALMKEIHKLGFVQGDKESLSLLIDTATEYFNQLDHYVDAGKEAFIAALNAAQGTLSDGNAMQSDVDEASSRLLDAMIALRLKADKSYLITLLEKADAIDANLYTAESVSALNRAKSEAESILQKEDATQQEVDAASDALQQAIDQLVAPSRQGDAKQMGETASSPKTGEKMPASAAVIVLVAAIALSAKRRKNK